MTARRIAIVTTSFPAFPGDPSGHFVLAEARLRADAGDRVTVLAPRPHPPPPRSGAPDAHAADASGSLRVLWLRGGAAFGWPGALPRLRANPLRVLPAAAFCVLARRALERHGPFDDVIAHWLVPTAWPVVLGVRGHVEVVLHGTDVRVLERLPRAASSRIVRGLVQSGASFRFVSHDLESRLARCTGVALGARARVAPSPLDVPRSLTRDEARAALGIPQSERFAVVVGRLLPGKRVDVAVKWARARTERVVVIGDGPARARLEREPATFLGRLSHPETLTWIAAADWLVSASCEEGAPTAVREARALGVPVVTADSGDVRAWALSDPGIEVVPTP